MPGITTDAGARILEGLELKSLGRYSGAASVGEESLPVRGNQVRQRPSLPHMPMEPEAAIHGKDHPIAPRPEFAKWNLIRWSTDVVRQGRSLDVADRLTRHAASPLARRAQLQAIEPSTVAGATEVTDP